MTTVDGNGSVQTLDSGPLSIASQTFLLCSYGDPCCGQDTVKNTDFVQAQLDFDTLNLPGNTPSFSGTATLISP
jgi:hypothetical protein